MKQILSLVLTVTIALPWISAQVVPPVVPPKPAPKLAVKFKSIAPTTAKAGDHIIIDASTAKGDVWFFFDEVAFPKTRATQAGKVLILSTQVNGKYMIDVASVGDNAREKIYVTVTGGIDPGPSPFPKPEPPTPTDPLEKLKADVSAIVVSVGSLSTKLDTAISRTDAAQAALAERVKALEGKPVPPVPVPPDPGPVPITAKLSIVIVEESAERTPAIAAVMKDLVFWRSLEAQGHKWFQLDKDQKDSKGNRIVDVTGYAPYMDKTGLPTLILMDQTSGKVLQAVRLPSTKEGVLALIKNITGK